MRLSDVRGDRTLDVIADLIDPISEIASDEEAVALFRREKVPEGVEPRDFFVKRARKAAPALLKGHKQQVIQILATIEGTDPEEYAAQAQSIFPAAECGFDGKQIILQYDEEAT